MDSRIALAFSPPDIVGSYQNALSNQQQIEAAKMNNALAAQEMADMQAAREFEKSPEGMKQRELSKKSADQKQAAEDIKNFLPMATPENWGSFGQYMGERYGNPGVFGGAYDEATHRKMMENFGIVKPQKEEGLNAYEQAKTDYLRQQIENMKRSQLDNQPVINESGEIVPPSKPQKAPTQDQANAATFGARAEVADKIISGLGDNYSPVGVSAQQTFGAAANWALSENTQKASQAQRDFINAVLRKESGATISDIEFDNAKQQYFPQAGDSDAVKLQKAQNRAIAIQGLKNAAGGATFAPNINPEVMGKKKLSMNQIQRAAAEGFGGDVKAAYDDAVANGFIVE